MPTLLRDVLPASLLENIEDNLLGWGLAVVLIVVGPLVGRIIVALLALRFRKLAQRTTNEVDDIAVSIFEHTRWFFLFALSVLAATLMVQLPGSWASYIRRGAILLSLIQAGIWGTYIVNTLVEHRIRSAANGDPAQRTGATMLRFGGRLIVWALVVLMALSNVGVDITALVAGLGVGGIAIALALQNVLGDLFASISILLDKPFVVGDFIILGDFMGSVEAIGIKTTRVRSLSGEQIIFPNNDLLQSRIRNYKRMAERRIVFKLGVTYQTPAAKLEAIPRILRESIESNDNTRFDRAHFYSFGDFALIFEVVYYMLDPDYNLYMDVQQRINLHLFRTFEAEGIEFAYPTQTLLVPALEQRRA